MSSSSCESSNDPGSLKPIDLEEELWLQFGPRQSQGREIPTWWRLSRRYWENDIGTEILCLARLSLRILHIVTGASEGPSLDATMAPSDDANDLQPSETSPLLPPDDEASETPNGAIEDESEEDEENGVPLAKPPSDAKLWVILGTIWVGVFFGALGMRL